MGYVSSLEGTTCKSFWTYWSRNFPSWRVSPVSLPSLSVIFTSFVQRRALRRKEVRQASPPRCQTWAVASRDILREKWVGKVKQWYISCQKDGVCLLVISISWYQKRLKTLSILWEYLANCLVKDSIENSMFFCMWANNPSQKIIKHWMLDIFGLGWPPPPITGRRGNLCLYSQKLRAADSYP